MKSYLRLLKESGLLWGVLFLFIPLIGVTREALLNDWTYIFGSLGFCIPLAILLIWNYKAWKNAKFS